MRERVLTGDDDLRQSALFDGSIYYPLPTVFQLKTICITLAF
ncbi:hypothetical protein [Halovenus amylolytica]